MKTLRLFALILITFSPVYPQDFIQNLGSPNSKSATDYLQRRIIVTGRGASSALQSSMAEKKLWALIEARKNCITQAAIAIGEISVESTTFLEVGKLKETNFSMHLQNYVRGIKNIAEQTDVLQDGSVLATVTMVIAFDGNEGLNNLLFNMLFPPEKPESEEKNIAAYGVKEKEITGVVFNVREKEIQPSMTPRIYSKSGELLYGPENVSREYALRYGIVGYTKNIEDVAGRIGENPVLVEALSHKPGDNSSIVVSNEDADRLRSIEQKFGIFSSCRVAFLVK